MKASVPQASVDTLDIGAVDVRQVSLGPLHVNRLVLDSLHVGLSTGAAAIRDLRVTVVLTLRLDWRVTVKIAMARAYSWGGTVKMGTHSFTVRLGDVSVPGLQSFSLDVARLAVDDVQAAVEPLRNLRLGPLVVEQLRLRDVAAPVPDFSLAGLGLRRVALTDVAVPAARSAAATIERVSGGSLPLGTVTLPSLEIPAASAGQVTSESVDARGTSNPVRFVADAGVLTLTLHATPGARLQAQELRLGNVRTSASVGAVELHDVVLPYELLDLSLSDIGIETISVPAIEVV